MNQLHVSALGRLTGNCGLEYNSVNMEILQEVSVELLCLQYN